jgi:diguanylate cyclase (GGDEF)-like protein
LTRLVIFMGSALLLAHLRTTQERLKHLLGVAELLARTDSLTGLANTRSFIEQAQASRRRDDAGPVSMLYVDIDNFKQLNDTYGHATGDEFLREVGRAIRASIRASDVAARVGGDEFAIVMGGTSPATAEVIARRLIEGVRAVATRFPQAPVGLSIGVADCERPPESVDDLLRQADDAMYRAKASGKARIVRWTPRQTPAE